MTRLPIKPLIPPEQVMLFIQDIQDRLTVVSLDANEYELTLQEAATRGLAGGRIYDALILRSAFKIKAATIYTWNLDHFQHIAPSLAKKIKTP